MVTRYSQGFSVSTVAFYQRVLAKSWNRSTARFLAQDTIARIMNMSL
jgi:hypothetical protein